MPNDELMLPEKIQAHLTTKNIGKKIYHYKEIDSTNNKAKILGKDPAEEGTVITAERQSGGRGRLGRNWQAPFGKDIMATVILRPTFAVDQAAKCTLLAAVAANLSIKETTGLSCNIKWPNDILWQERKMVGILTEMSFCPDGAYYIVIGIGINVNTGQADLSAGIPGKAASILTATGKETDRARLLASFLNHLEILYDLAQEKGFSPILDEWRKMSSTLGQQVEVIGQNETFTGIAVDIDDDGALLVNRQGKIEKVLAGEVSVRKISRGK